MIFHARRHCFNYIRESTFSYSKYVAGSQILKRPKCDEFEQQKTGFIGNLASKNILLPPFGVCAAPPSYILIFNPKITFSPTFEQKMERITQKSHICLINTDSLPLLCRSYQYLLSEWRYQKAFSTQMVSILFSFKRLRATSSLHWNLGFT